MDRDRQELVEEQKKIINGAGGEEVLIVITDALNSAPDVRQAIAENPKIPETWITLSNRGVSPTDIEQMQGELARQIEANRTLQDETEEQANQIAQTEQENEILKTEMEQLQAALELGEPEGASELPSAIAGDTTLCAYLEPGDTSDERGSTVPIGVVLIEESGITLLHKGYRSDQSLIDFYGDTFARESSEQIINSWSTKGQLPWVEFESITDGLNLLGDNFASDSKQKCRHYFNYYFVSLDAESLEKFRNLNYTGVKISEQEFLGLTFINANTDYEPITRVRAEYPAEALEQKIEGFSLIAFTVSKTGTVLEESIVVIDSTPPEIFDEASRKAIARMRFQPRLADGQAVDVANVRYRFTFVERRN